MDIKLFLSNQWHRIQSRVPAVVRNFPVASGVIMFIGLILGIILCKLFS